MTLWKWFLNWKSERWFKKMEFKPLEADFIIGAEDERRFKEMDFKPATLRQKELLTKMLYHALVEIRFLCWDNKTKQAADLADAFHNLPSGIYAENFSFLRFRGALESYQSKYLPAPGCERFFDYTEMLDKVLREEDLWPEP